MKHIDVKFNIFRWFIFLLSTIFFAYLAIKTIKIRYLSGAVGGLIGGSIAYFFFYFKDEHSKI